MEGQEVLCKIDISQNPQPNANDTDDRALAESLPGYLGQDWSKLQKDVRYTKHYNVTKEDALATYDELGNKIPYDGPDKDEVVKFTQWDVEEEQIE
jgi:hypothetical protein